jgi:hypothetical protein
LTNLKLVEMITENSRIIEWNETGTKMIFTCWRKALQKHHITRVREREGERRAGSSSDQLLNEVENYSIVKAIGNEQLEQLWSQSYK